MGSRSACCTLRPHQSNTIQLFVNADYPSVSANNCPERYPLFRYRFRSRTPGPPPFSSMIST